jgi:hypothetical protein
MEYVRVELRGAPVNVTPATETLVGAVLAATDGKETTDTWMKILALDVTYTSPSYPF